MTSAKKIEKVRLQAGGSLETIVDLSALAILILGSILAVGTLCYGLSWYGLSVIYESNWVAVAIGWVASSFLIWLLLRCIAEHLRLQKKIAGLPFWGSITGPKKESYFSCGQCGQLLHSASRCDACGADVLQ